METFGTRLKMLRERNNLTMHDVVSRTGISQSLLSNYENNLRNPTAKSIAKLAECFNVTTDYMLGLKETKNILTNEINIDKSETAKINQGLDKCYDKIRNLDPKAKEKLLKVLETVIEAVKN